MSRGSLQVKLSSTIWNNVEAVFFVEPVINIFLFFFFRFLIVTDYLLQCPELVKALYAKLSNQER